MKTITIKNNITSSINHFQNQNTKTMTQTYYFYVLTFNPIQDGPFQGCLPMMEGERPPSLNPLMPGGKKKVTHT